MGCCGEKRNAWLNESKTPGKPETADNDSQTLSADKPDRVFEYSGDNPVSLTGVVSGKTYQFRFRGDKQAVDHRDAFAMMALTDLNTVKDNLKG